LQINTGNGFAEYRCRGRPEISLIDKDSWRTGHTQSFPETLARRDAIDGIGTHRTTRDFERIRNFGSSSQFSPTDDS